MVTIWRRWEDECITTVQRPSHAAVHGLVTPEERRRSGAVAWPYTVL
jgi:hypothetical protein